MTVKYEHTHEVDEFEGWDSRTQEGHLLNEHDVIDFMPGAPDRSWNVGVHDAEHTPECHTDCGPITWRGEGEHRHTNEDGGCTHDNEDEGV